MEPPNKLGLYQESGPILSTVEKYILGPLGTLNEVSLKSVGGEVPTIYRVLFIPSSVIVMLGKALMPELMAAAIKAA